VSTTTSRLLLVLAGSLVPGFLTPVVCGAQARALAGRVTDTAGAPLRDADIGIIAARRLVRTDSTGRFYFAQIPDGRQEVSVRRLGFTPRKIFVHADSLPDTLRVALAAEPHVLAGVGVTASETRLRRGIEDFYRRRVKGVGTYWTRDDIDARHTQRTSDLMRGAPGLRLVRIVGGGLGVRMQSTSIVRRDCIPMIWVDGQRAPGLEVDDILTQDIEGIEIYSGPATTPTQFSQYSSSSTCGTIVFWTRIPGNRPRD
jgi:hypothetical protein